MLVYMRSGRDLMSANEKQEGFTFNRIAYPEFSVEEIVKHTAESSLGTGSPRITEKWTTALSGGSSRATCSLLKARNCADHWGRVPVGSQFRHFDPGIVTGFVPTVATAFERTFVRTGDPTRGAP